MRLAAWFFVSVCTLCLCAPAASAATVSPTNISFGQASVGSTSGGMAVTVTNSTGSILVISNIALSGADAGDFVVMNQCGAGVLAGQSCQVVFQFTPNAPGTRTATATFTDSASDSPQAVSLNGVGVVGGFLTANPPSVIFGAQTVGTSSNIAVTFTNGGTSSLSLGGVSVSAPALYSNDFSLVGTPTCGATLTPGGTCTAVVAFTPQGTGSRNATLQVALPGNSTADSFSLFGTGAAATTGGLTFVPVTPCRVADTRLATGPLGGPMLAAASSRDFAIPNSACGIPLNVSAYSLNVTIVPTGQLGFLTIWPSGQARPLASTLNSDGRVKANAAIVPAGSGGAVSVYVSDASHVILDINGYFAPAGSSASYAFYPLTPCRVADTRTATGLLGGPFLAGAQPRTFPVLASGCGVPPSAQAYSLNFTAVPHAALGFLATWPSGQAQPEASTLNAPTAAATANAAIVPAGVNGSIDVYASSDSDVVIDVNGYFGPLGPNGYSLYGLTPCRVLDTRTASGALNGPLTVNVSGSACAPPAAAYVMNATVVPVSPLGYLSLWPNGVAQPVVSTLNASDSAVTSNMAITPATAGAVNVYASNPTQVILDISSYFAP